MKISNTFVLVHEIHLLGMRIQIGKRDSDNAIVFCNVWVDWLLYIVPKYIHTSPAIHSLPSLFPLNRDPLPHPPQKIPLLNPLPPLLPHLPRQLLPRPPRRFYFRYINIPTLVPLLSCR